MTEPTIHYFKKRPRKKRKVSKLTGEKIYSRAELEAGLWSVFSQWVRLRERDCVLKGWGGHKCSGVLQAGHVLSRRRLITRYDEDNVHTQCQQANYLHQYHPEVYHGWFIQTYGADVFLRLVKKSELPAKKLSPQQLIDMIYLYARKIESLKGNR